MSWITLGVLAASMGCHPSAPESHVPAGSAAVALVTPASPAPAAVSAAGRVGELRLLSATPSQALQLRADRPESERERWGGKLVIDGVHTQAQWPQRAPVQYRVDRDRHLLYDSYNESRLLLWNARTKRLTDFGRMRLLPIGDKLLLARKHTLVQLHPEKAELVPLYQAPDKHVLTVAGMHRGRLLLAYRPHPLPARRGTRDALPWRLVWLQSGAPPQERSLHLEGYRIASSDGVRGDRLLLIGGSPAASAPGAMNGFAWDRPFRVGLAVLDLRMLAVRALGTGMGDWTQYTAMPHPYSRARWSSGGGKVAPPTPGIIGNCVNLVDPRTEAITQRGCQGSWRP